MFSTRQFTERARIESNLDYLIDYLKRFVRSLTNTLSIVLNSWCN